MFFFVERNTIFSARVAVDWYWIAHNGASNCARPWYTHTHTHTHCILGVCDITIIIVCVIGYNQAATSRSLSWNQHGRDWNWFIGWLQKGVSPIDTPPPPPMLKCPTLQQKHLFIVWYKKWSKSILLILPFMTTGGVNYFITHPFKLY